MWDQHVRFPQALHSQLIAANVATAANPIPVRVTQEMIFTLTHMVIRGVTPMLNNKCNILG